jgi:hypothetical protein
LVVAKESKSINKGAAHRNILALMILTARGLIPPHFGEVGWDVF